ncbi:MAG: YihY/virulence factor BrkB family protein [Candidatus Cloacimonadaceae bacterium]|nr:YihY/virulence factor BrkB family protein [Candidatus Cloacimonadaceae bacterium]
MAQKKKIHPIKSIVDSVTSYIRTVVADYKRTWDHLKVPRKRKLILRNVFNFFRVLYSRITSEGVLKESASLTYITILGFLPFITFIFLISPDLPFLNLKVKFQTVVANNFFPGSAQAIIQFFDEMMTRRAGFNVFNFIVLIISSYSLFRVIRDTFDRILSLQFRYSQDILSQIIKFFGTIIFGLFIMILLFSSSSLPVISRLLRLPGLQYLMFIIPFVLQFLAMLFLYMLLPTIRIKRSSLFRGAFWTTLVWVLAKTGFDFYIYRLTNITVIYGVMAALPIFLMWIYINWAIILGGIVLVSVIENKDYSHIPKADPKKVIRLTVEMYTNDKINNRIESFLKGGEMKNIAKIIDQEEET